MSRDNGEQGEVGIDPQLKPSTVPSRTCNLELRGVGCGKPAVTHIMWALHTGSFVCDSHVQAIVNEYKVWMKHRMGPYCGMPGAGLDPRNNRCVMPSEGIPVSEKKRYLGEVVS